MKTITKQDTPNEKREDGDSGGDNGNDSAAGVVAGVGAGANASNNVVDKRTKRLTFFARYPHRGSKIPVRKTRYELAFEIMGEEDIKKVLFFFFFFLPMV